MEERPTFEEIFDLLSDDFSYFDEEIDKDSEVTVGLNIQKNNEQAILETTKSLAKKVAEHLGIELRRVDFIKEYWDHVFTYFLVIRVSFDRIFHEKIYPVQLEKSARYWL